MALRQYITDTLIKHEFTNIIVKCWASGPSLALVAASYPLFVHIIWVIVHHYPNKTPMDMFQYRSTKTMRTRVFMIQYHERIAYYLNVSVMLNIMFCPAMGQPVLLTPCKASYMYIRICHFHHPFVFCFVFDNNNALFSLLLHGSCCLIIPCKGSFHRMYFRCRSNALSEHSFDITAAIQG